MLPAEFVVNHWVLAGAVLAVLGFAAWWRSRKFPGLADDFSWVRLSVKVKARWGAHAIYLDAHAGTPAFFKSRPTAYPRASTHG
jgi:hypothetical protein